MSNSGRPGDPDLAASSEAAIVVAYAEHRVSRTGPDASRPALKKYGDCLFVALVDMGVQVKQLKETDRPDFRVNEPNLRAPAAMPCSISSVWYFVRFDMVLM